MHRCPSPIRKALESVTLDDKYTLDSGRAFMSGVQALVRLPMLQRQRDARAGLNTAGFISGYRGSPLGGYDQALWAAKKHLAAQHIVFQPGVNEELAATAVWGTQQLELYPKEASYDGVFGIWYGKGPGVDRCSDVFKHANMAGTSRHGGVIAIAGDDHVAKSSTAAHQSDHIFKACGLPVFFPAGVQDILDMGLHAFAMSRFSGVWSGMKTIQEVVESSSSVVVDPDRVQIVLPEDFAMPPGGLHIRWPDAPLEQEARLMDYKWYAALAYVRANRLNHNVIEGAARPLRHHRQRQGLQRHAPGARRPGAGRRHLPPPRHPAAQGQRGVAAGSHHHARLRAGAAGDPGRRGKAPGHRVPAQGRALQLAPRRAPERAGQVRRRGRQHQRRRVEHAQPERELAAARQGRPDAGDHRQGHREAAEEAGRRTATSPRAWTSASPSSPRANASSPS